MASKRMDLPRRVQAPRAKLADQPGETPVAQLLGRATHVIFDMDGVLLATEKIYTEVTREIVARFGKTYDWSIKSQMIGRPSSESARYLVETLELPISPEQYLREREVIFQTRMPQAAAMPGAVELVRALSSRGIPMAVATSSHRDIFQLKTTHHRDWFRLFDRVVLGDDPRIERGKPAPDIFLLAASELGAKPSSCIVFEDAPSGVEAARAAGMLVIGLPDPGLDQSLLARAHHLASSLDQIPAEAIGKKE